jgi:hypothetical protein
LASQRIGVTGFSLDASMLRDHGVDLNTHPDDGKTALSFAEERGPKPVVQWFCLWLCLRILTPSLLAWVEF